MKRIGGTYGKQTSSLHFDVSSDMADITAALKLYEHRLEVVLPEHVNSTVEELAGELRRRVTATYNVPSKEVSTQIRKASQSRPRGMITISGRHIPLYDLDPNPTTRYKRLAERPEIGVSAQIKRTEARTMFAGAFIADMPSRGMGVYKRIGRYGGQITHLTGPSVPQMVLESVEPFVMEEYVKRRFYQNLSLSAELGHQGRIGFGK